MKRRRSAARNRHVCLTKNSAVRTSYRRPVGVRPGAITREHRTVPSSFLAGCARAALLGALVAAGGALVGLAAAHAPPPRPTSAGRDRPDQSGNYLAALVASADRDTAAAAVYFREALRADPRNVDLIERAFAAALADGDVANGFPLADRLIARDPGNSLARLALAARAIARGPIRRRARPARRRRRRQGARRHDDAADRLDLRRRRRSEARARHARPHQGPEPRGLPRLSRRPDRRCCSAIGFEAQRRLKAAYEADKNTLRLADAYARFLARHGDVEGAKTVYQRLQQADPQPSGDRRRARRSHRRQAAGAADPQRARRRGRSALWPRRRRHAPGRRTGGADLSAPRALSQARPRSGGGHRRQPVRGPQAQRRGDPRL